MRIGIVAEGSTDFPIIQEIITTLYPNTECERLWPPKREGKGGWAYVRKWCRKYGKNLKVQLSLDKNNLYNVLLIVVDADVAYTEELNIAEPCPPASDTTDKLRKLIIKDWLSVDTQPHYVVLCIPSLRIEAWIAGAFKPDFEDIECSEEVDDVLIKLGAIQERIGRNKKSTRNTEN
ncbi:MAG: hypothetical protein HQ568_09900 [Calditrichaeota bacterium]|nr:hypothetical protein [Calditrichota bacterium]